MSVLPVSSTVPVQLPSTAAPSPLPSSPRRSALGRVGRIVGLVVLIIAAMTALGPLLWTLTTSMRTPAEAFTNPPQWIPLRPDFSNYSAVFDRIPIGRFFFNSVVVTGLIVLGQTVTCTLSGYAFAMVDFPGRSVIFTAFLATMMVPLQTIIIPVFVIVRNLGLADTTMSLVVSALGNAFGTFLMRQYFMQMPKELGEAARIDGAGHWRVFQLVYAKMAGPAIATLAILNFSGFWAEFYRPLIFLQSQDNFTLPLGLVGPAGQPGDRVDLGRARRRRAGHAAERDPVHRRAALLHRRRDRGVIAMTAAEARSSPTGRRNITAPSTTSGRRADISTIRTAPSSSAASCTCISSPAQCGSGGAGRMGACHQLRTS